jgi:hypothetical protein
MEEKYLKLNDDQKALLLKSTKDLHFVNGQLHEWVKKDTLTEGMSTTLPSLIEGHFTDIAKLLSYESHLTKEKEKRHKEIRNANMRIRELEQQLASTKPVDGLKEQLKYLVDIVRSWWNEEGFNFVTEERFMPSGALRVEFSFMLEMRRSSFSDTPETDKRDSKQHIERLRSMGFEFCDFETGRSEKLRLIDNQVNRDLLTKMLRNRFPSLEIVKWDNRSSFKNSDIFTIWHVDAIIYDLNDIPND